MNNNLSPENPGMDNLVKSLQKIYSRTDITFLKQWPASKPDAEKTDVVWKIWNSYIKWFTKTWRVLWEVELRLINLFNSFSKKNNSTFSWPEITKTWYTENGEFYFVMDDAKKWGKEELDFSKMNIEEIMKLYNEYRSIFDEFEKYSKWKTSTESNPKIQLLYSLYKRYLQPEVPSQQTKKISNIINWVKKALWNTLQPAFKLTIWKKYKDKINERISNGNNTVEQYGINIDKEEINTNLDKLLSKVKSFNFEYNFWRFWTWHVFSDWTEHKFVDFDNISYQIKWTELIGIMRSNVLLWTDKYDSYEDWKSDYDKWYNKITNYQDENLVKFLLFIKLVWTIFEDYGNLINKRNPENTNSEKIKKWIKRNYKALQELINHI